MISTVTTTTTTTTAAMSVATGFSTVAGIGLAATISLIILLIIKELAGAAVETSSAPELTLPGSLDRFANVGVIPLLFAFTFIVVSKVLEVLH